MAIQHTRPTTLAYCFIISIAFILGLALYSLAFGAQAFPFKTTDEDMTATGWTVTGTDVDGCDGGLTYTEIHVLNTAQTIGWYIFYSNNYKIVGGRYNVKPDGDSNLSLISFGVVKYHAITIVSEEPFDRTKHTGPCDWFEEKDA